MGSLRIGTENFDYSDFSGILGSRIGGMHGVKTRSVTWEHANVFAQDMDEKMLLINYDDTVVRQNEAEIRIQKAIEEIEKVNKEIGKKKMRSGFVSGEGEG
jgi:hypothetical protein